MAGASPDGIIDLEGGIEIKNPTSPVHLATLLDGMSDDYLPQVQGAMWITGYDWWDFVSYDPRMPDNLQVYVQRIERDNEYISKLDAAVRAFSDEVDATIDRLMRK